MSADVPEPDGPTDERVPDTAEPAFTATFGWVPPLVPLPRRAPDELF